MNLLIVTSAVQAGIESPAKVKGHDKTFDMDRDCGILSVKIASASHLLAPISYAPDFHHGNGRCQLTPNQYFVTGNPADHSPSFLSTRNIFLRPNPVLSSPCQGRYAPLFIEPHTGLGKLNHVTNLVCTRVAASMLWQPLLSSSLKEVPCSEVADTVVPI